MWSLRNFILPHRRGINVSILIVIALLLLPIVSGAVLRVDPVHGNDVDGCGKVPSAPACRTISFAVQQSLSGDTIFLTAGVYDCPDDGHGVQINNSSLLIQSELNGAAVIDCQSKGRALWYIDAPAVVSGVAFRNGNHTDGGGAIRIQMQSRQTNIRHQISNCSFDGHLSNNGGAAVDLRIAAEWNVTIDSNSIDFNDCSFSNGISGSSYVDSPPISSSAAAGAVSLTYYGATVQNNRNSFNGCAFFNNSGGSKTLVAGAGAVTITVVGQTILNNEDIFVGSSFTGNQGGNGNQLVGAGAISVLLLANNSESTIQSNIQSFTQCSITNNIGGNKNGLLGSGGTCGAGGVCIAIISLAAVDISGGSNFMSVSSSNRQTFNTCEIVGNTGGTANAQGAVSGGVSGAAGVGILISSHMSLNNGISNSSRNAQTFSNCTLDSNVGGDNNGMISVTDCGGAGGISIVIVAATLAAHGISAITSDNTQLFSDCIFRSHTGGTYGCSTSSEWSSSGGAGAVNVVLASSSQGAFGATNTSGNTQSFSGCIVDQNGGGWKTLGTGPTGAAGGINILLAASAVGLAVQADGNVQTFTDSSITSNYGGENSGVFGGGMTSGSGGMNVAVIAKINGGLSTANYNTQSFLRCNVSLNVGGTNNGDTNNGGNGAGGASILVASAAKNLVDASAGCQYNSQLFVDTVFQNNVGGQMNGNNDKGNIGGSGAGGLSIALAATADGGPGSGSTLGNLQSFRRCQWKSNSGGFLNGNSDFGGVGGGACSIFVASHSNEDSIVLSNTQTFEDSIIADNVGGAQNAGYGMDSAGAGGIAVMIFNSCQACGSDSNSATLTNCTFLRNQYGTGFDDATSATGYGGGFSATIFRSFFPDASQPVYDVLMDHCIFDSNIAPNGGAVALVGYEVSALTASFVSSQMINNLAQCEASVCCCNGGAMHLDNAWVGAYDSQLYGNVASFSGGAVILLDVANLTLTRCSLRDNHAAVLSNDVQIQSTGVLSLVNTSLAMVLPSAQSGSFDAQSGSISGSIDLLSIDATTVLSCPLGSVVVTSPASIGCRRCESGSYLLSNGTLINGNPIQCSNCEFGAECSRGGNLLGSQQGYYGVVEPDGSVAFTLCATDYCCNNDTGTCDSYDACTGHRAGLLCGECAANFSEMLGSTHCRANENCNDLQWFVPLCVILSILLSSYFLMAAPSSAGTFNVLAYFFQLAPFMQLESGAAVTSFITDLFRLQPSGGASAGVCVPNMTAVEKEVAYFFIPLLLLLMLCVVTLVLKFVKSRNQDAPSSCAQRFLPSRTLQRDVRLSFSAGLVKLGLFTYSVVAMHALTLLRCIPVDGVPGSSRLLTAAYVECYQPWQWLLIVLVLVFLLAPLGLGWWLWCNGASHPSELVALLAAPYRLSHWESILLFYRLIVVVIHTACTNKLLALLLLLIVNMIQLSLQLLYRPFKSTSDHHLQTMCIACLIFIAMLSLPSATLLMNASVAAQRTSPILHASTSMQLVAHFLPLALLVLEWFFIRTQLGIRIRTVCSNYLQCCQRLKLTSTARSPFDSAAAVEHTMLEQLSNEQANVPSSETGDYYELAGADLRSTTPRRPTVDEEESKDDHARL